MKIFAVALALLLVPAAQSQISVGAGGSVSVGAGSGSAGAAIDPRNPPYNAHCNWNGTSGTDDTSAFQSAVTAAHNSYVSTAAPVNVLVPTGCTLVSVVNVASGVHLIGPGSVNVPNQTVPFNHPTFQFQDADDVQVSNVLFNVVTSCDPANDANCAVIRWQATTGTSVIHKHIYFRHNTIHNSNWGILVVADVGTEYADDVDISDNTIESLSKTARSNYDGIHIGGQILGATIVGNRVSNRGDAAIGVTTDVVGVTHFYCCGNAVVADNIITNSLIGLDNSGASNVTYTGNQVSSTISQGTYEPAFRSVYFTAIPKNIHVVGNTLGIGPTSTGYTIQIDPYDFSTGGSVTTPMNITLTGNVIHASSGANCLYERGSGITVSGNTFDAACVWETAFVNPNQNNTLIYGTNSWLGNGTINLPGNPALIGAATIAPQFSVGTVAINSTAGLFAPVQYTPTQTAFKLQAGTAPLLWGHFVVDGGTQSMSGAGPFDQAGYQIQFLGTSMTNGFNGQGAGGIELIGGSAATTSGTGNVVGGNVLLQGGNCTGVAGNTCYGGSVTINGGTAASAGVNNPGAVYLNTGTGPVIAANLTIAALTTPGCLQNDGSGNVSSTGTACGTGGGGGVSGVSGTAPVVSSGGTTPVISMAAATDSVPGYLTAADHATFNGKQAAGSYLTSVAVTTANGVSGSSSGGTTPSLTLSLGAITPTSTNGVSAATLAFMDATSSIQTQLNGKQASGSYQGALTLTTTGTSGAATLVSNTLNIPQYSGGSGTVTRNGNLTTKAMMIGGTNGTTDVTADTGCSTDGAGILTCTSYSTNGTTPGKTSWVAGTGSIPALEANSAGFAAPVTGGTAFLYKLPSTAVAGVLHAATPGTVDGVNESALTSSGVAIADLTATGSPSSTTFLRGDNTWSTPAGSGTVTVVGAGTLTSNAVVIGGGTQTLSTIAADTTTTHALFATAGGPGFRAVAAGDLPSTLTSGTAITNAALTTPTLGVATATSINKVAFTAPTTAGTIAFGADNSTATLPNGTVPRVVASGTASMGTTTVVNTGCSSAIDGGTATGVLTTDVILVTANADPTAVTGYTPATTGSLYIWAYPTADHVNFKLCNNTTANITPGSAVTLNWKVIR